MKETPKPRRQLGLFDATMIVMGGIVGAGIFANPSEVAHRVHTPFLILGVWVLGGLIAMCGAFIWAELARRLPAAEGGQYVYLREAGDHWICSGASRRCGTQIGSIVWAASFIWPLEKYRRGHGSDRFCLRRMADSHFRCGRNARRTPRFIAGTANRRRRCCGSLP